MYRLDKKISEGKQGEVFELRDEPELCAKIPFRHLCLKYLLRNGISSLAEYEMKRAKRIRSMFPSHLQPLFVDVVGVDSVLKTDGSRGEALIMELIRDFRGGIAETLMSHLLSGSELSEDFWQKVLDVKGIHEEEMTGNFDFNLENILVEDEDTPRFIDFLCGYQIRLYQPWLHFRRSHIRKIDKTFWEALQKISGLRPHIPGVIQSLRGRMIQDHFCQ